MAIRAILFDVGGPIDTEVEHERLIEQHILEALHAVGVNATDTDLARASRNAVAAYAPNTYAAIIWSLVGRDLEVAQRVMAAVAARDEERARLRGGLELREGIAQLLASLHERGYRLGLAANQPARVVHEFNRLGIADYFDHREVSGHHGIRKPDARLFLRACASLDVDPTECILIGDRIDCDIVPARLLGMHTILFRTGRHIDQQPRSADELPHAEVASVDELGAAIEEILA